MSCKNNRGKNWSDEETAELISIWSDDVIQEGLEGPRNKDIFEKISKNLMKKGHNRSIEQCREKIKKLKKDYRKVIDNNNETGRNRRSCKFFEEMDAILGVKPATKPSLTISSESGLPSDSGGDDDVQLSPVSDSVVNDAFIKLDNEDVLDDNEVPPTSSDTSDSVSKKKFKLKAERPTQSKPTKRRKPATRLEKSLELVIGKFMEGQKDMEARYIDLEEKRMKLEVELEKQRMEMEEKRREAERQHEKELYSILRQTSGHGIPFSYGTQSQPHSFSSYYHPPSSNFDQGYGANNN